VVGRVFDNVKHINMKEKAEYRRIGKNYKSLPQYKREREWRRRILELQGKGLTIDQIASELGVSGRTVKRDLARVRSYVESQRAFALQLQNELEREEFSRLSLSQKLERVKQLVALERDMRRKPRFCSVLQVIVDLDALKAGKPAVRYKAQFPVRMLENSRINLDLMYEGKVLHLGRMWVANTDPKHVDLQTN